MHACAQMYGIDYDEIFMLVEEYGKGITILALVYNKGVVFPQNGCE